MRWRTRTARWLARLALVCTWCHAGCGGDDHGSPDAAGSGQAQAGRGGGGGNGGGGGQSAAGTIGSAAGAGGDAGGAGSDAPSGGVGGSDGGDAPPDAAAINPDAGAVPSSCGACAEYAAPVESGRVEPAELAALSGLAWSRTQPEVLYAHNDHDRPVVYALDLQGRLHARIDLADASAEDIEDIAVGPCGTDSCVYLGDIGDNPAARAEYAILRFVEPSIPSEPGLTAIAPPFERFAFTYEDGSHNAEGLMVAPDGDVYIVTKLAAGTGGPVAANGVSSVYRLAAPLSSDSVATALKVATLPIPAASDLAASAAAAHPCEPAFLVRTYDRVYELRAPAGEPFAAALTADPVVVAMPDEPQSEGIDYRPDGRGFASSGEGASAPIMLTGCR